MTHSTEANFNALQGQKIALKLTFNFKAVGEPQFFNDSSKDSVKGIWTWLAKRYKASNGYNFQKAAVNTELYYKVFWAHRNPIL